MMQQLPNGEYVDIPDYIDPNSYAGMTPQPGAPSGASAPAPTNADGDAAAGRPPKPDGPGWGWDPATGSWVQRDQSSPYKDFDYWAQQGVNVNDIMDPVTGQPRTGWARTANGYERAGSSSPGTSGGASGLSPFTTPFQGQFPTIGDAPVPNLPTFKPPPAFQAPTAADVLNEPGFGFRVKQGNTGIQNWAAARGTLNDGETAEALSDYNQNAASQEYGNVWNRAYSTYNTNYQTQYTDPFKFTYQRELDQNAPALETWRARNAQGNTNFDDALKLWDMQYRNWAGNAYLNLSTLPV